MEGGWEEDLCLFYPLAVMKAARDLTPWQDGKQTR